MSLPSITETKNATLLRIRIVISAVHYTATSSHFCNSRPEAGGHHPQQTARPTAPDLFKGQVPRHPHTISYAILLMDPVPHITLTMFPDTAFVYMQATSTFTLSNFYIMEFLGLMAAIPRCTARPRRSPAGGRHGTVHLPGAHRLYWISTLFYHSAEDR